MRVKSWQHLRNVDMEIVDVDCAVFAADSTGESLVEYIKEVYKSGFEFVEIEHQLYPTQGPNDPLWEKQWGMQRVKADVARQQLALASMGSTPQKPVVVAVIDSGILLDHEDLRDMLWTNPGEIPGNGIDDDGNGYIDDVHGYDFFHDNGDPNPNDPNLTDWHGTHCAGILGATINNGAGMAGMAGFPSQVRIMALQFMNREFGTEGNAIRALEYAVEMGARISSNSWGGYNSSQPLEAAMKKAAEKGHLFVTAAGNDGLDLKDMPAYPCVYSVPGHTICVASISPDDNISVWSNYGASKVNIAAPGDGVWSTTPDGLWNFASGTSMATPFVSGAAALAMSAFPGVAASDVQEMLLATAERLPTLTGKVESGLLDVPALMDALVGKRSWFWWQQTLETELEIVLAPGETTELTLQVGQRVLSAHAGTYDGCVEVQWPEGSTNVSISYTLLGWPLLEPTQSELNWGDVLVGTTVNLSLVMHNLGDGVSRARLLEAPPPPFEVIIGEGRGDRGEDIVLDFACAHSVSGSWEAEVTILTNSGLDPLNGSLPTSVELGTTYEVKLRCVTGEPPYLLAEHRSGASIIDLGTPSSRPWLLQPSVVAEWEPGLASGQVSADLATAPSDNIHACEDVTGDWARGRVVFVERGPCQFSDQANRADAAGALGIIFYDDVAETTHDITELIPSGDTPGVPGFLISRDEGLALKRRLDSGENLQALLTWEPIVVWSENPVRVGSGVFRFSNEGGLPLEWSSSIHRHFHPDDFYEATILSTLVGGGWADLNGQGELPAFAGRFVDDEATVFELPFPFPFHGQFFDQVTVSSNGVLAFGNLGSWVDDHIPKFRNPALPNALIAAFWDDLVHPPFSRLSAALLPQPAEDGSSVVVIQFANFTFYDEAEADNDYAGAPRLSFEVRLHSNGQASVNVLDLPFSALSRDSVKIGIESPNGANGKNVVWEVPQAGGSFSVTFTPWFVPLSNTSGVLAPGEDAEIEFFLPGQGEDEAWLTLSATAAGGQWSAVSHVRISQRKFSANWVTGPWGPCTGWPAIMTRAVECVGSDGVVYDDSLCAETLPCQDAPGSWFDSHGNSCHDYSEGGWCTSAGATAAGWDPEWGSFESRATLSHTAATACCACGGGITSSPIRREYCETTQTATTTTATTVTTTITSVTATTSSTTSSTATVTTLTTSSTSSTVTTTTTTTSSITTTTTSTTSATTTSATTTSATATSTTTTETTTTSTTSTITDTTLTGTKTTTSTTTGTTRTTVTMISSPDGPGARVSGAIYADATQAEEFVADSEVPDALAVGLGEHVDVPADQVSVGVEGLRRRLAAKRARQWERRLDTGPVRLDYIITLPPSADILTHAGKVASLLSPLQARQISDQLVSAMEGTTSATYQLLITSIPPPTIELIKDTEEEPPTDLTVNWATVLVVMGATAAGSIIVALSCLAAVRFANSRKPPREREQGSIFEIEDNF